MRAELPGIDPDKDVQITLEDNVLTLHGERREEVKDKHRSEFRYGAFSRAVRCPRPPTPRTSRPPTAVVSWPSASA